MAPSKKSQKETFTDNRNFRLGQAIIVKVSLFKGEIYVHFFNKKADKTITLSYGEIEELKGKMRSIVTEARKLKTRYHQKCLEAEKVKAKELLGRVDTSEDDFSEGMEDE
jgi:FtsZ-binding cell division protein ZapB